MKKTLKKIRVAGSLLLFFCASFSFAQGQGPSEAELGKAARSQYENSPQLPDGLAFVATMRMLKGMKSSKPDYTVDLIESEMGLDTVAAQELVDSLLSALDKFDSNESATVREILCENGVPKAYGASAFALLRSMDDARAELADSHLLAFRNTLDGVTHARFQQWLEYRKLNIVHVTYDHEKMAQLQGRDDADVEVSGLCIMLEREHVARGISR